MTFTAVSDRLWDNPRLGAGFWALRRFVPAIAVSFIIFPAALFLYGQLPAATVRAGPANALSIEHQSWGRMGAPQDMDLRVERSKGRTVTVFLDERFAQSYAVEATTPLAKTVTSADGGTMMTFEAPADADLAVNFTLRPLSWGRNDVPVRADVSGVMMANSTLSQIVLP